jgi:hypothetical protein
MKATDITPIQHAEIKRKLPCGGRCACSREARSIGRPCAWCVVRTAAGSTCADTSYDRVHGSCWYCGEVCWDDRCSVCDGDQDIEKHIGAVRPFTPAALVRGIRPEFLEAFKVPCEPIDLTPEEEAFERAFHEAIEPMMQGAYVMREIFDDTEDK